MNWTAQPLDRLVDLVGGGTPSKQRPDFWRGDIPWVSPKDMVNRELTDTEDHISEEAVAQSATQIVPSGSVLVVVRSGILIRHFPIALARRPLAFNQDLKALIPRKAILPEFLAYALTALSGLVLQHCVKRGATVHSVDVGRLKALEVPLPPLSEQRRIVEILDQADRLRRLRAEADAKADRILLALFVNMFGDPSTNPMGWRTGLLGDAIVETQYGTSKRAKTDGQGVLVLRMNNVSSAGGIDLTDVKYVELEPSELERHLLQPGDIVFNRTNSAELVGKTGLWTESDLPAVAASYLIRVRVKRTELVPAYAWALMNTPFMKTVLATIARRAVGMANINASELRRLPGMFPPLQLQRAFVALASSIRQVSDFRHRSRAGIELLFRELLSQACSGTLTASWRKAHMKELLREMRQQARVLAQGGAAP